MNNCSNNSTTNQSELIPIVTTSSPNSSKSVSAGSKINPPKIPLTHRRQNHDPPSTLLTFAILPKIPLLPEITNPKVPNYSKPTPIKNHPIQTTLTSQTIKKPTEISKNTSTANGFTNHPTLKKL